MDISFYKYTIYTIREFELYELLQDSVSIESLELKVKNFKWRLPNIKLTTPSSGIPNKWCWITTAKYSV